MLDMSFMISTLLVEDKSSREVIILSKKLEVSTNSSSTTHRTCSKKKVVSLQNGVMRTNCLDCLDRTNLVQSKIAYDVLTTILSKCGF